MRRGPTDRHRYRCGYRDEGEPECQNWVWREGHACRNHLVLQKRLRDEDMRRRSDVDFRRSRDKARKKAAHKPYPCIRKPESGCAEMVDKRGQQCVICVSKMLASVGPDSFRSAPAEVYSSDWTWKEFIIGPDGSVVGTRMILDGCDEDSDDESITRRWRQIHARATMREPSVD